MRLIPRSGLAGAGPVPPGGAAWRNAASAGAGTAGTAARTAYAVTAGVSSGEAARDPGQPRARRSVLPRPRPGTGRDGLRSADHYTRLMPVSEAISGGFQLAMLPVRLIALGVLWATATPTRLIVTAAICTAVAISL